MPPLSTGNSFAAADKRVCEPWLIRLLGGNQDRGPT